MVTYTCYTCQAESTKTKSLTPIIELIMQILVVGVRSSEMVSRLTGRRLPTWGVFSHTTMVGICLTTGRSSPISTKIYSNSSHNIAKISYLCKNFHATLKGYFLSYAQNTNHLIEMYPCNQYQRY